MSLEAHKKLCFVISLWFFFQNIFEIFAYSHIENQKKILNTSVIKKGQINIVGRFMKPILFLGQQLMIVITIKIHVLK